MVGIPVKNPKALGTRRERDVVDLMKADGWIAFRVAGSLGPADVVALRRGSRPQLIQVKAGGNPTFGTCGPAERNALSIAAKKADADAIICLWKNGASFPRFIFEEDWPLQTNRGRPDYLVDDETGCWIWRKSVMSDGYGSCRRDNKSWLAHRWYYTQSKGTIPRGLEIDHLCRVRLCVNPDHLEAVTRQVNIQRTAITKLTPDEVREIRAAKGSRREIAERFGISVGWVSNLRTKKKRGDVPDFIESLSGQIGVEWNEAA